MGFLAKQAQIALTYNGVSYTVPVIGMIDGHKILPDHGMAALILASKVK